MNGIQRTTTFTTAIQTHDGYVDRICMQINMKLFHMNNPHIQLRSQADIILTQTKSKSIAMCTLNRYNDVYREM